jgi:ketosteroid isomerase-like protein
MKKILGFLLFLSALFILISCVNTEQKKAEKSTVNIAQEKVAISKILDDLAASTESGNFQGIQKIWWPSEDVLLIGTESGEKLVGWTAISKAIKKQFRTFGETLISITDQSIWVNEDASVAWFFEELNYNFVYEEKAMTFEGIRFTGVMQKHDGQWRLVQQHMSIPSELEMVESK